MSVRQFQQWLVQDKASRAKRIRATNEKPAKSAPPLEPPIKFETGPASSKFRDPAKSGQTHRNELVQLNVRVDPTVKQHAQALEKFDGVSLATIVESAIEAYFENSACHLNQIFDELIHADVHSPILPSSVGPHN